MSDWIGLGIFVLVIAGAVAGLSFLGKPRPPMSNEEFEQRAAEARGTTGGGGVMYALQKLFNPAAAKAVEVQQDLRAGRYHKQAGQGEGDEPGLGGEGRESKEEDEKDA
jgi:hypothetical protein